MKALYLAGAGALGLAFPVGHASAATVGSATFLTYRSCGAATAADPCDGSGPGQQISNSRYGGGVGSGGTTTLSASGGFTWSNVTFAAGSDLPTIKAYSQAPGNARLNVNVFAFQSYKYTGAAPIDFSITGTLHIVNSSSSPAGGAYPGGSIFSQYLAVWDPSILGSAHTAQELINTLFYADCGTTGVLGASGAGATLTGGEFSSTVTTTACAPASLRLTPGQEVLVVAGLQLPVNRGGFADASHTFETRLGDDLPVEVKEQLAQQLVSAIGQGQLVGVPEPATWAMMIAGFGLAGASIRRTRKTSIRFA